LNVAAWMGSEEEIERVLNTAHKIKINKRDKKGFTALHWAGHKGLLN